MGYTCSGDLKSVRNQESAHDPVQDARCALMLYKLNESKVCCSSVRQFLCWLLQCLQWEASLKQRSKRPRQGSSDAQSAENEGIKSKKVRKESRKNRNKN